MRLINCISRPLATEEFYGSAIPRYAILSHTWEEQEVTYQQFADVEARASRKGWSKVQKACELAMEEGHDYIWIDSCCIDKSSSAELSEAINSMFEWYLRAEVCFAYLSDYDTSTTEAPHFWNARWFFRGWTLQELIAPTMMFFYDKNWSLIGNKTDLCPDLSQITGVDAEVLCPSGDTNVRDLLDDLPVGLRMSWASRRKTTRIEDQSYCLLGIFGINMPMLYGEGPRAFVRLQEEIVKISNDMTLFAWAQAFPGEVPLAQRAYTSEDESRPLEYRGIFASTPAEFWSMAMSMTRIVPDSPAKFNLDYAMSNKGLRIRTSLKPTTTDDLVAMPIYCHFNNDQEKNLGIFLKHQGGGVYVRARPHVIYVFDTWVGEAAAPSEIFIVKSITATAASKVSSVHRNAFVFRFAFTRKHLPLVEAKPRHLWDAENELFITDGIPNFVGFHRFETTGTGARDKAAVTWSCVVACGFSGDAKTPWVAVGSDGDDLYKAATSNTLTEVARIGAARGILRDGERTMIKPVHQTFRSHLGKIKLESKQKLLRGEPVVSVTMSLVKQSLSGRERLK
ncbi:HET domain-containing protein [Rutstroemia sp. NJR-2017a WRK4]|nr:HET domain-containing protein [Rutstroemia sp. NJR-2017a WRK4]